MTNTNTVSPVAVVRPLTASEKAAARLLRAQERDAAATRRLERAARAFVEACAGGSVAPPRETVLGLFEEHLEAALSTAVESASGTATVAAPLIEAYYSLPLHRGTPQNAGKIAQWCQFRSSPGEDLGDEVGEAVASFIDANTGEVDSGAIFGSARGKGGGTFRWADHPERVTRARIARAK